MKRIISVILLAILFLCSCRSASDGKIELSALPADYSLEEAKRDGCVVHEDGKLTYGRDIFMEFVNRTEQGKEASVRLGFYYTLDIESVSKEYYEKNKSRYPVLYIKDLTYDGEKYTVRHFENGKEITESYKYMKLLPFYPKNLEADYKYINHYVLLDDCSPNSYDTIWKSLASSRMGDYIAHSTVYSEYISK